jgi:hypothetical protein
MKKIGELLVEREWLTREQLHQALKHQQVFGGRLGTCLLELSLISEDRLIKGLSEQLGVPPATAEDLRVVADGILELVPAKVACRVRVVPFERFGNAVSIALLDTRDLLLQDELGFVVSKRLKIHVAPEVRILEALDKHYHCRVDARFSRIWDRLNRTRYMWQEETMPAAAARKTAPAPPATTYGKPTQSWQPAPPPPLDSGITTLASLGVSGYDTEAAPPRQAPVLPPPPAPPAAPRPSPLRGEAAVPAPSPVVSVPQAPPPRLLAPAPAPSPTLPPAQAAKEISVHADTSPLVVPKAPESLAELEELLGQVEERDDVAHAVLSFLERRFQRRLLFMVRGGAMAAWMGSGIGVDQKVFGAVDVSFEEPSLFLNLREGSSFYRGPLPRLDAHQRLVKVWGGKYPRECLLLPVRVRDRMVAAVYCDRGTEGLSKIDVGELQQMAALIGRAFERYLVKKKSGA